MSKKLNSGRVPVGSSDLVRRLEDSEARVRELLQDRDILHQDGERWRAYGKQAIAARNRATEALEAADECLALIEDVGHGAHMDNVTVARKLVREALADSSLNGSSEEHGVPQEGANYE